MVKPVLTALMPMCVALILASALMCAVLIRGTLTASADETVRIGHYQIHARVVLELWKVDVDTVPMVADTLEEVTP